MTSKNIPLIKKGWLRSVAIVIPWIIISSVFSYLAILFVVGIPAKGEKLILGDNGMLAVSFCSLLATLLVVWVFRKFIDKKPFYTIGFIKKDKWKDILLGIIVGFVMIALGFLLLKSTGEINIEKIDVNYLKLLIGLLTFIFAAMNEEIIFRGYLLNNFMDSVPKYWALIITSILFGVIHLGNADIDYIGFSNIIFAGIFLGISYIYTKSIWFPFALHFSWNFFQGTIFGYSVSGNDVYSLVQQSRTVDTIWNGGAFGFEASLTALIFLVIFTTFIGKYYSKKIETLEV